MNKQHIQAVRMFNRFYTSVIGLVDNHILNSKYSLPEVRIMYEVYNNPGITASDLINQIGMDKGYLSRILKHFKNKGIICKTLSSNDKRATVISLSKKGIAEFKVLDKASEKQISKVFKALSDKDCNRLIQCMTTIKELINIKDNE